MERAKRVLASRQAEVFTYDTTVEENSIFSLNMGCRGVMRVLLEAVDGNSEIVAALRKVWDTREPVACAVLIGSDDAKLETGRRLFLTIESAAAPQGPSDLCGPFPTLCEDLLTFGSSASSYETISYETADGLSEFVFEMLRPPIGLVILGAGADAVPLADAASYLGWQVSVYDHRPAFLNTERFANADEVKLIGRDMVPDLAADELTAVVLMNHNYDRDKAMLPAALRSNAFYVGALGPKKRTQQILDEHKEAGETFEIEQLARMRSPAGLDIGGDSPETIAVSIIAEIQSVLKKRPGGPLRDRSAPIYDRK
jgi:xanthine dehydrogenase accessory factor